MTTASPCSRVCAGAIVKLALAWRGTIDTWTIAYHAPYRGEGDDGIRAALQTLNAYWDGNPQIRAFQLQGDSST
jgi:hypothetical protein